MGRHAAGQIRRLEAGRARPPFSYHDKGTMATIGSRSAVVQLNHGIRFRGTIAWLAWLALHLRHAAGRPEPDQRADQPVLPLPELAARRRDHRRRRSARAGRRRELAKTAAGRAARVSRRRCRGPAPRRLRPRPGPRAGWPAGAAGDRPGRRRRPRGPAGPARTASRPRASSSPGLGADHPGPGPEQVGHLLQDVPRPGDHRSPAQLAGGPGGEQVPCAGPGADQGQPAARPDPGYRHARVPGPALGHDQLRRAGQGRRLGHAQPGRGGQRRRPRSLARAVARPGS